MIIKNEWLTKVSHKTLNFDDSYLDKYVRNSLRIFSDEFSRPKFGAVVEMMRKEQRDCILYSSADYISLWQHGKRKGLAFWIRKVDHSTWVFRIRHGLSKTSPLKKIPRRYQIGTVIEDGVIKPSSASKRRKSQHLESKENQISIARAILASSKSEQLASKQSAKKATASKKATRAEDKSSRAHDEDDHTQQASP